MFGWEFPPYHSGGLGVACEGLVRGLAKNNVRVTLVLPHNNAEENGDFTLRSPTENLCNVVRVRSALKPYEGVHEYEERISGSIPHNLHALYGPNMADAVEHFAKMSVELTHDLEPDVVHCHDWMTYEAASRAANYHGVPMVAHIHATELDRTHFRPHAWIAERERAGLLKADRVIAVSNYTKSIIMNHYGIQGNKIDVVHNGHNLTHQAPRLQREKVSAHPLVMFLGRLTIQKNPMQFLEVARRICNVRPEVRFVMAGEGHMLAELISKTCQIDLAKNVLFAGKLETHEVQTLFAQADCFVMPSLSEPFGLVALEAVAHGVPVVLSKQSGACEVIDHAFKIDFWDTERMADCILTILREEPLARQLRSHAPRVLEKLTWGNQASEVHSVYKNAISSHAKHSCTL